MTEPEPPPSLTLDQQRRAFELTLAGLDPATISRTLEVQGDAVTEVNRLVEQAPVGRELALAQIDALWGKYFVQATEDGDAESLAACLKLLNARTQVLARMRTPTPRPGAEVDKLGDPKDINRAWRMLAGGAEVAVKALIEVAEFGRSDFARVNAATAILDRVGLGTSQEVTVRAMPAEFDQAAAVDTHISPAQVIRNRMKLLASQTPVPPGEEVLDAEIVSESEVTEQ